MTLTRRDLIRSAGFAGAAAALAPVLSACGSVATASTGAIQYWNPFTGGDGGLMKEMVGHVERVVPGLKVTTTVLEWGASYYTKLAMASAGGRAPDVAVMHVSRFAGYAPGGLLDPWDTELLREFGVTGDDLNPDVFHRGQYQGEQFALPLDAHPFVVFYDKELMDKAGLVDTGGGSCHSATPMATWKPLRSSARSTRSVVGSARCTATSTISPRTGACFGVSSSRLGRSSTCPERRPASTGMRP